MRFHTLHEDNAAGYTGYISAASKWGLPGSKCPSCGNTWASAAMAYPQVDLSAHPSQADYLKPRAEPLEEFERLRESIRPLVPAGAQLPPGTRFGPLVGTASGSFGAFHFQNPWTLLVRGEAMESLQKAGVQGLKGRKPELRFRQKKSPPDLVELQLEPHGLLHSSCLPPRPSPCPRCSFESFQLPEHIILNKASLPAHTDVFRLANFATVLIGSERFKEAVQRLKFDGVLFNEVPLRS